MNGMVMGLSGLLLPMMAIAAVADDSLAQGNAKLVQHDFKGAMADYDQAVRQNPQNVPAYLSRAKLKSLGGDFDGAIVDDTTAIALDPKNAIAFSNRGNARAVKGDLTGAIADYTQAIALDPQHVRALVNRGNVENLQKNYTVAVADYSAALALDPKNLLAYYNRGTAKRALGDFDGAFDDYSQTLQLNALDVQAWLNRAVLRMAKRDWTGAESDLDQCLKLVPQARQCYPRIYLWVTEVHQGEGPRAAQDLLHYLHQDFKNYSATWALQIANFLAGKTAEATFLSSAQTLAAAKNRGQWEQANYYVGLKRLASGDQAGAMSYFGKSTATHDLTLHEVILAGEEMKNVAPSTK